MTLAAVRGLRAAASVGFMTIGKSTTMSIKSLVKAIEHCRAVIEEWPEAAQDYAMGFREVDTRYAFIDPIIRGSGWNISDPKECVAELWRGSGRLDYTLFDRNGRATILKGGAPIIAVEAKSLWGRGPFSDDQIEQLEYYVMVSPAMEQGLGVLTNGADWWVYDITKPDVFADKRVAAVDITEGDLEDAARELHKWLDRERWW